MPSVTRRPKNSRAARRDQLRGQLLEVVERLIDEGESFTEISVERIAAEAGVSRSTFYVYFADKGDMLSAWVGDIAAELAVALSGWWAMDANARREDLRSVLENAVRVYRPHMALMAAAFHAATYDAGVRELTGKFMDENIAALQQYIEAGQESGFVDPSLPAGDVASWLLWMAERGFHVILRDADDATIERQLDAYTAIVWNTLYAPAARG
jgi:TetR/AcrR family transcriptional regulator, ethionamide resistance regulator